MEGPLSYEDCKKALDTFQNNKAPGEDGFTVEFYTFFFDLLGHDLVASFNAAYDANELAISQRRGVTTLIPKESLTTASQNGGWVPAISRSFHYWQPAPTWRLLPWLANPGTPAMSPHAVGRAGTRHTA